MNYSNTLPAEPYLYTIWLAKFDDGEEQMAAWHQKAKVGDVIKTTRMFNPGRKFRVTSVVDSIPSFQEAQLVLTRLLEIVS